MRENEQVDMNRKAEMEELKKEYQNIKAPADGIEKIESAIRRAKMDKKREQRKKVIRNCGIGVAAALVLVALPNTSSTVAYAMSNIPVLGKLVEVVTFRDYTYEDERNSANIETPELAVNPTEFAESTETEIKETLEKTTDEINAEIQAITDKIVAEFEEGLEAEENHQVMEVKHEVINTTQDYFTLKLVVYQSAGSGMEWNYFYTIDLKTGERMALKDLFKEGADFITPISENIIEQMKAQMAADESLTYWLESEVEEWNFKQITEDASFYINEAGNIVINFNEGDVAPMYMGVREFEIPNDVTADIRK